MTGLTSRAAMSRQQYVLQQPQIRRISLWNHIYFSDESDLPIAVAFFGDPVLMPNNQWTKDSKLDDVDGRWRLLSGGTHRDCLALRHDGAVGEWLGPRRRTPIILAGKVFKAPLGLLSAVYCNDAAGHVIRGPGTEEDN